MRFEFHGMNTLADPASIDVLNPKSSHYGQCVDIVNCDLDDEHNASLRAGLSRVAVGDVTSAWTGKAGVTYCVSGGYLCTFNGSIITTLTTAFTVLPACEFEDVNDVVVFSDNVKIGVISGSTVTRIDKPSDWVDVASLDQWIKDHYPADPAAWNGTVSNSNFEVDAFKLAGLAGKCLCFFNGALYLAIDNFVYCTRTFDIEHMDIRFNVVAGFPDPVTMISCVAGGLYVGTAKQVVFLDGGGIVVDEAGKWIEGFTQRPVSSFGAIYGTSAKNINAELIPQLQATGELALWSSKHGIYAGLPGGVAVNLSDDKIALPDVPVGTATVRCLDGIYQYVVCFDIAAGLFTDGDTKINAGGLSGTYVLNLRKTTHSRYVRFPFNSLFSRGSDHYGTNKLGVFKLTGDTDFSGVPALAQRIDAHILTPSTDFGKRQSKSLQALYLQARCGGEMAVDLFVDEQLEYEDDVILFDDNAKVHTLRADPPRGLSGTFWQFRLKNVNGSRFTVFNLEPVVNTSTRTR